MLDVAHRLTKVVKRTKCVDPPKVLRVRHHTECACLNSSRFWGPPVEFFSGDPAMNRSTSDPIAIPFVVARLHTVIEDGGSNT